MPCDSSHMKANTYEIEISRVVCLLEELDGKKWSSDHWDGYHPKVYCKANREFGDRVVSELCGKLQKLSSKQLSNLSLELQMWWRDHKKADKEKLEKTLKAKKREKDRAAALAKLTPYERRILEQE